MAYINTEHLYQCTTCKNHNKSGCATFCNHGEQYIPDMSKIPTADIEEVRHGEWIWTENGEEDYEQFWVCSVCKEKSYIETKFCSDCGAKMDGGKKECLAS